jgi:chorismate mutase
MSLLDEKRDEIAALDVRLLATINERIRRFEELQAWKAENGVAAVDPKREQWLVSYLQGVNTGPLSDEGVEELITFVLALVKKEATRG